MDSVLPHYPKIPNASVGCCLHPLLHPLYSSPYPSHTTLQHLHSNTHLFLWCSPKGVTIAGKEKHPRVKLKTGGLNSDGRRHCYGIDDLPKRAFFPTLNSRLPFSTFLCFPHRLFAAFGCGPHPSLPSLLLNCAVVLWADALPDALSISELLL